jgi:hypothetical protein
MLVAAFQLSVFDLKYGKFPQAAGATGPDSGRRNFRRLGLTPPTWYDIGEPLPIHTEPGPPPARKYGVCTVLIPALGARLTVNGVQAKGRPFPTQREGRPFSTCALAFSESWTEAR